MAAKLPPPIESLPNPLAEQAADDSRFRTIVLCSVGLALLWFLIFFGVAAQIRLHPTNPFGFFIVSAAFLMAAGLGAVMAAWTIGGPGFLLIRAATAIGGGMCLAWGTFFALASVSNQRPPLWLPSTIGLYATWLTMNYGASLVLLAVGRNWGWRLMSDYAAQTPTTQFRIFELMQLVTFSSLACAVVVWAMQSAMGSTGYGSSWSRGVGSAFEGSLFIGAPVLIVNGIALGCGLCSLRAIAWGGFAAVVVASVTATIFVCLDRDRGPDAFYDFVIVPAAIVQYLFIVMSVAIMHGALQPTESNPSPLADDYWQEIPPS